MSVSHILILCGMAVGGAAVAQTTVHTDPMGFLTVMVQAHSDAVLSVPMRRPAVFEGAVTSVVGNQVTLGGMPALPAGTVYGLMIASGAKEGMVARITAQTGATLTLSPDAGDDFLGVATGANGDSAKIIPYWTPASLFPATVPVGTQILGFESAGTGVNLAASQIYVHTGGGAWENGVSGAEAGAAPLPFGAAFVVRNNSDSVLKIEFIGEVPTKRHRVRLFTLAGNTPQDIRIGYGSHVPEKLEDVGLGAAAEGDQILGFDNSAIGFNKSASQLLIMDGGVWRDQVSGNPAGATFQFIPGFGYIFRKAATGLPTLTVWSDLPVYLPFPP